jgi:regulator of sigma D
MTEAVGQIMNLRRERKQEEALLFIDELLDKRFRLSSKLIRSLSDEDLMKVMTTNGVLESDHMQAIGVLMKQEAELHAELRREDESFYAYVKALHLFIRLTLADAEPTIVEPREQVTELLNKLSPYELPMPTKRLLLEWHEAEGHFDLVENMMHELLAEEALELSEAEAVYRRMLLQTDERLQAGDLPREEVLEGLEQLLKA